MKQSLFFAISGVTFIGFLASCSAPVGLPKFPAENIQNTGNIAPGSLRSGDQAINRNNIDAILNNPDRAKSEKIHEQERPGLATGWGKEKASEFLDRDFVRASSKPAGIDMIFYNSKDGIKAMSYSPESVSPLQTAAGGLIEWGIKGGIGFLPAYKEGGYARRMVAGEHDGTYSIFIRNRSKSALEIVASVDGLDVNDGKPASYVKQGYVVGAGETATIEGFRTSRSTVASFKFSTVSNSYANLRHGDARNVGVIGLAVFTQKGVDPWTWMPKEIHTRNTASPFAAAP